MSTWLATLPVLALLVVPWALSVVAAALQVVVHQRLLAMPGALPRTAGSWLRRASADLGTRVEVHSALPEAYYPHVDTVGLSPVVDQSRHALHRAMVAHELGHARSAALHPAIRQAMPIARLLASVSPFATAAAWIMASLTHSGVAVGVAVGLLVLTAAAHAAVLFDEVAASRSAWTALGADREIDVGARSIAGRGLLAALAVYAAPVVGWFVLVLASPLIVDLARHGPAIPRAEPLDPTGTWLILFLGPFLLLHAGLVLSEAIRPEPVRSAFQLNLRQERVAGWGFVGGACALLIAVAVAGWSDHPAYQLALGLAIFTGLQPLTVLVRAVASVLLLVVARLVGLHGRLERAFASAPVPELHPPRALADMFERPAWSLRSARLAQLAWVPLLVLAVALPLWR